MSYGASFASGEAGRIAGIPFRTLDHWARTGFVKPTIQLARGTGSDRLYSRQDILILMIARELRNLGVATAYLARAVKALRQVDDLEEFSGDMLWIGSTDASILSKATVDNCIRSSISTAVILIDIGAIVKRFHGEVQ